MVIYEKCFNLMKRNIKLTKGAAVSAMSSFTFSKTSKTVVVTGCFRKILNGWKSVYLLGGKGNFFSKTFRESIQLT